MVCMCVCTYLSWIYYEYKDPNRLLEDAGFPCFRKETVRELAQQLEVYYIMSYAI